MHAGASRTLLRPVAPVAPAWCAPGRRHRHHAALTLLGEEDLLCPCQGLLVHVDLDGRLLVFAGREQPEGLVHEQVFQAVVSEAWGPDGPGERQAPKGDTETFTGRRGGSPALPWGLAVPSTTQAAPGLTTWAVSGPAVTVGDTLAFCDPQSPRL